MGVYNYLGNANGLAVDANGAAAVGGVNIVDFPASQNLAVTQNNIGAIVKNGFNNTFLGQFLLVNTGSNNAFLGAFCGTSNTTGTSNTFMGAGCGQLNTTGNNNTFFGYTAGNANVTGQFNTFVGYQAGLVSKGDDNSFFGTNAGLSNTTGSANVFFGEISGQNNTVGAGNCFIGLKAGFGNISGGFNTVIGTSNFDNTSTTGSNNTLIGCNLTGYGNVSGTVIISDGSNTKNLTLDANSARFTAPVRPRQYAVSALPSASLAGAGSIAYTTNGRKASEAALAGTGVPVFSDGANWLCFYNNLQVTA